MRLSEIEASSQEAPKEPSVKKESVRLSQLPASEETSEFETARKAGEKYFPKTPLPQILAPTVAAGAGELVKGAGSALELVAPETGKKVREYGRGFVSGVQKGQPLGGFAGQIGSYAIPFTAAQKGVQALRGGQAATSSLGRAAEFGAAGGAAGFTTTHGSTEERTLAGALGGLGAGGFSIAFDVATKGLKYVSDTLRKAYGGDVKRLTEDLRNYATKRSGHEADLAKTLADQAERQVGQAGVKAGEAESRAAVAETAAGRQARAVGTEYGRLPGVATKEEAGRMKPIPASEESVGDRIRTAVDSVYSRLKEVRNTNAEKNKAAAFGEALAKEKSGLRVDETDSFKTAIKAIDDALINPETKLANVPVQEVRNQLTQVKTALQGRQVDPTTGIVVGKPVSFEGLELMRRNLNDRAYGLPAEGFDAIGQQQAGKLAKSIEGIMEEFSPSIRTFLSQYKKDSAPLQIFKTKTGKIFEEQLPGVKGYAKVPSENIPDRVFKNREGYQGLIEALGNNRQLAEAEAKRYFVSQMEKLAGDPKKLEGFIRDNRTMLNLTNARPVVEGYLAQARTLTGREAAGTARAGAERKTAEQLRKTTADPKQAQLAQEFEKLQSDFITARTPSEVARLYESLATKLLRDKSIDSNQYQAMSLEANKILNTISDSEEAKRNILGAAWRAFAGTGAPGAAVFTAIKSQGKR
ncbi:hypothetical protein UFOVP1627_26 [uncultured Caudovirales phage]|uniref:Uncharacterized protein n=1 Tax=uncultured Caudovirales phage TaxID=2100421 RepID=A0A6J7XGB1_9CAUD|nr:hypothetical protein UFOVP1113_10 [uncultured Caudovirales phage]CAB4219766.1 hypothetical protein UFOVP1627_26 [uncultured Caudovirales phage]CAB5229965.1 hypothetical protein UFOVP1563_44 [uncultured Caudovirales phage]